MQDNLPAILGGKPIFDEVHHLVRPDLPPLDELTRGLEELYERRILTNQGRYARQLEREIADYCKVKHCALFCNGTVAIMALLQCLGLEGEVIIPSFTFAATATAVAWQGLEPKFVDIDRATMTVDPERVAAAITPETSAIFPVNIFGNIADHDRVAAIAQQHGLPLVYDSAQAFGSTYRDRMAGSLGDAETFSFHATKIFHTGEGGAVTTNDSELYGKLCRTRNFGFASYLNCVELGINGKLPEFSALLGLELLKAHGQHRGARARIRENYRSCMKDVPGLEMPVPPANGTSNNAYRYFIVHPEQFGLTNLELNYALMAENIVTRCYFYPPVHRTKYFRELQGAALPELPETDWASRHVLCFPNYVDLATAAIEQIGRAVRRIRAVASEVRQTLRPLVPHDWDELVTTPFVDPYDYYMNKRYRENNGQPRP